MSLQSRLNRIRTLALTTAATLALALAPLSVTAAATGSETTPAAESDAPHAADEDSASLTLTVTQYWDRNRDNIDLSADYALTPETTSHQEGYTSDTAAAVEAGLISFQIGNREANDGAFTLTGDGAATNIVYHWTSPGLYVFRLHGTSEPREDYTYDGGYYLIRVYVRSDGDSFITAENEAGDKVAAITLDPQYYRHGGHHHHDDDGSTPVTPLTPTDNGTNGGVGDDGMTPGTGDGIDDLNDGGGTTGNNHQNAYTGDGSHMTLYGAVAAAAGVALIVWTVRKRRAN